MIVREFEVVVLLNVSDGAFNQGFVPGESELVRCPGTFRFLSPVDVGLFDDGFAGTAEDMFAVGNRMAEDMYGHSWASHVRSLSKGDLILVRRLDTYERRAMSCESVGWKTHEEDALGLYRMAAGGIEDYWPADGPHLRLTHDV